MDVICQESSSNRYLQQDPFPIIKYYHPKNRIPQNNINNPQTMRNKSRVSIDEGMTLNLSKTHSMNPINHNNNLSNMVNPSLIRKSSTEMLSIHNSTRKNGRPEIRDGGHEGDISPILLHRKKHSERYKQDTDGDGERDLENYSAVVNKTGFQSATENNRITFSRQPPASENRLAFKTVPIPGTPTSVHSSSKQRPKRFLNNVSAIEKQLQLQRKLQEQMQLSQGLQKVVQDLEQQNKNIMSEAKRTVTDFENYIEQLLESNRDMQANLLQYEKYIEMLENQRSDSIQQQKQREKELQKSVRQNIGLKKQLDILTMVAQNKNSNKAKAEQQQQQQQLHRIRSRLQQLQQQLVSKQQLIKMMEQSMTDKQDIIKKMTQFNNQMCLQIMTLKNGGIERINQAEDMVKRDAVERRVSELVSQNVSLKEYNAGLCRKIKEMLADNEIIIPYLSDQMAKIQQLNRQQNPLNGNDSKKPKNKMGYLNDGQYIADATFEQNFQFSQILPKENRALSSNFNPFGDDNMQLSKAIMNKIYQLLQQIKKKVNNISKEHNLYKLIKAMIKSLRSIVCSKPNNSSNQSGSVEYQKQDNILESLDDEDDNNFNGIVKRNNELFNRINNVKKRLRTHITGVEDWEIDPEDQSNGKHQLKRLQSQSSTGVNLDEPSKKATHSAHHPKKTNYYN